MLYDITVIGALLFAAWVANWVTKRILLRGLRSVLLATHAGGDRPVELRVIPRLANVVPALVLWLGVGISGGWLHVKTTLVVGLLAYNHFCGKLLSDFKAGRNQRSHVWFRWFNEVPVLVLLAVTLLVVLKPF